jgi:hypothetical protein
VQKKGRFSPPGGVDIGSLAFLAGIFLECIPIKYAIYMEKEYMSAAKLLVPLNRQQLDLIDRTLARGLAPNRAELLRLALREYTGRHDGGVPKAAATARPEEGR